jgi:hypothetical protein
MPLAPKGISMGMFQQQECWRARASRHFRRDFFLDIPSGLVGGRGEREELADHERIKKLKIENQKEKRKSKVEGQRRDTNLHE